MNGNVMAVSRSPTHVFSKPSTDSIRLLTGLGVEGDAHCGATVKHRSLVAADPTQPNLRQVHLIHGELLTELHEKGFRVAPGQMGENITTCGIDLLSLPTGAQLSLGETAMVEITGLRRPCAQLDSVQPGLMAAVLGREADGTLILKCGVMGVVLAGGEVRAGDPIRVLMPPLPHEPLERV